MFDFDIRIKDLVEWFNYLIKGSNPGRCWYDVINDSYPCLKKPDDPSV
jgi:hypothetical protein